METEKQSSTLVNGMSILINIEDLLSGTLVEGTRMEFKQGWNPGPIMRTICAFANDFENEGSGYIIVGVEEVNGKPVRPVLGFDPAHLEKVEKEILQLCNLIKPTYFPRISLEAIDGKHVLVIWVPSGSNRPYKVPDDVLAKHKTYNYRIRFASNSIVPNPEQEQELIQLTAKIPFDDRVNTNTSISELSLGLMREHLFKTKSKLYEESSGLEVDELAEQMNLCNGAQEHLFPKNVGLLMFSDHPERFFKGAYIDYVEFPEGIDGQTIIEKRFTGPIQRQLEDVLHYLQTHSIEEKTIKIGDKAEADKFINYPFSAIEEALSNAVYHRNYEMEDPIEVRVLPNAIEIISFNGVDPSLKQSDFDKGVVRARRYRNRRIGDFLKELRLTEGRGTGIPTIIKTLRENGSPAPVFDANEPERTHFVVEIPIHPVFVKSNDQVNDQVNDQANDQDKAVSLLGKDFSALLEHLILFAKPSKLTEKQLQKYDELASHLLIEQVEILRFCATPKSNKEVQQEGLKLKVHTDNFKKYIDPLLKNGLIARTIPTKPNSPLQKYFTTEKGTIVLRVWEIKFEK